MSQLIANQVNCLQKLQDRTGQLPDMLAFLKLENLIDDNMIKSVNLSPDQAKDVQQLLRRLQVENKLQMLVYEWNVLPHENICITIVTDRNQRDFTFNR